MRRNAVALAAGAALGLWLSWRLILRGFNCSHETIGL